MEQSLMSADMNHHKTNNSGSPYHQQFQSLNQQQQQDGSFRMSGQGSMRSQLPPRSPQVIHPVGQHNPNPMGQPYGTPTRHRAVSLPPMMQQQHQQVNEHAEKTRQTNMTTLAIMLTCVLPLVYTLFLDPLLLPFFITLFFNLPSLVCDPYLLHKPSHTHYNSLLSQTPSLSQANQQSPHYHQQGQQQQPYYHNNMNNNNNGYQTGMSDNSMGQRVESPIGSEFRLVILTLFSYFFLLLILPRRP